jgi:hypothetical protein
MAELPLWLAGDGGRHWWIVHQCLERNTTSSEAMIDIARSPVRLRRLARRKT